MDISKSDLHIKWVMSTGISIIAECADKDSINALLKSEIEVYFDSDSTPRATGLARLFYKRVTQNLGVVLDIFKICETGACPRAIKIVTESGETHFIAITDMFDKQRARKDGEVYTQSVR